MAKRCDVCGKGKMYGNKVTFQIKNKQNLVSKHQKVRAVVDGTTKE